MNLEINNFEGEWKNSFEWLFTSIMLNNRNKPPLDMELKANCYLSKQIEQTVYSV